MTNSTALWTPGTRAYSYLRFSTPEQQKGDSFRRQSSMAASYAGRHGLELDEELTFHDLGRSAFRGQNLAEAGRLADFLEAVRSGLVARGSVLLVEQLDRISRQSARKALRALESIVDAGVAVVTLNDERAYTATSLDEDPMDLLVAILTFMRANEESATKARRVKAAWEAKRQAASTTLLTKRAPSWLKVSEDGSRFELLPDRAAILQRIFEDYIGGTGQHAIAESLNREGFAPWGSGKHWHKSYVSKLLRNPAVIGTLVPHTTEYDGERKSRVPQSPVEGYFPAAVHEGLWLEAQALQSTRRAPSRGRHATQPITNILAGLASCPLCGGTFTRTNKGKRGGTYMVCATAKAGAGCEYKSVPYPPIQDAILKHVPTCLNDAPAGSSVDGLDAQIGNTEAALDGVRDQIESVLDNLSRARSAPLAERLRELENEHDSLKTKLQDLIGRRSAAAGPLVAKRIEALRNDLHQGDVGSINKALRAVFRRATVDYSHGQIELEWIQGGEAAIPFTYPRLWS